MSYTISERLARLAERRTGGDVHARVQAGAHQAATSRHNSLREPTPAQADAGNYRKGRFTLHGLPIAIENPAGSMRRGVDKDGKAWECRIAAHYGDISGTRGADGDPVDVFVGPFPESREVWVINQALPGQGFDEHKVMMGFGSEAAARAGYTDSYSPGWSGLQSIVPATVGQLKWWLKHGDMSQPFSATYLPLLDGAETTMDKILWTPEAAPVGMPLNALVYAMRQEDREGLLLDGAVLAEFMADVMADGAELLPKPVLDALVIPVARMTVRMDQLQRVMNAAGTTLQVTDYRIADPIKARGVLQVAVMFALSDGQAVTIWFHNPDTTPAKLTPLDELVSWKWLLNKKDITIVVAPERGRELNVREVARRVMKLAEKNSARFQEANKALAEKQAQLAALDTEIGGLETRLAEVQVQIAEARQRKEDGEKPMTQAEREAWLTSGPGYATIRNDEAALLEHQDLLDSIFQQRLIGVRNELRAMGWEGQAYKPLTKNGYTLVMDPVKVGAGGNVVGMTYHVGSGSVIDGLESDVLGVAQMIDALTLIPKNADAPVEEAPPVVEPVAAVAAAEETIDPASVPAVDPAEVARDVQGQLNARAAIISQALIDGGMVRNDGVFEKGPVRVFYSAGDISVQQTLKLDLLAYSKYTVKTVDTVAKDVFDSLDVTPEETAANVLAEVNLLLPVVDLVPAGLAQPVIEQQPVGMVANDSPDRVGSSMSARIVAINDAFRALGYTGDVGAPLEKAGYYVSPSPDYNTKNEDGSLAMDAAPWTVMGLNGFFMSDDLTRTPDEFAAVIDAAINADIAQKTAQQALPLDEPAANAGPAEGEERRTADGEILIFKDGHWFARVASDAEDGEEALELRADPDFSDPLAVVAAQAVETQAETEKRLDDQMVSDIAADLKDGQRPISRADDEVYQFAYDGFKVVLTPELRADIETALGEPLVETGGDTKFVHVTWWLVPQSLAPAALQPVQAVPELPAAAAVDEGPTLADQIYELAEIDMRKAAQADDEGAAIAVALRAKELGRDALIAVFSALYNYNAPMFSAFAGMGSTSGELRSTEQMADLVLAGGFPPKEAEPAAVAAIDPAPAVVDQAADDRAWLQSLVDGTVDVTAADVFDRLEPLFEKYAGDADMQALLEQAARAYEAAVMAAATAALTPA